MKEVTTKIKLIMGLVGLLATLGVISSVRNAYVEAEAAERLRGELQAVKNLHEQERFLIQQDIAELKKADATINDNLNFVKDTLFDLRHGLIVGPNDNQAEVTAKTFDLELQMHNEFMRRYNEIMNEGE